MEYDMPLYRPPSEGRSLIIQATYGCSANTCTFCLMYKGKKFKIRRVEEVKKDIDYCARAWPDARRVFLADGDALVIRTSQLLSILDYLYEKFPRLERVTSYANPLNLIVKSQEDLDSIRRAGLTMLYYGVESGDDEVLKLVKKKGDTATMIEGVDKAHKAGFDISVTVLLGLAGRKGSEKHARLTARLLNRLQPAYIGALTLMLGPFEHEFAKSMGPDFEFPDKKETLEELRTMIEEFELENSVFRTNHASNWLPLKGVLNRDKDDLLRIIDEALSRPDSPLLRPAELRSL
ncbi:MAG: radical SAM protein [bacterium]